MSQRYVGIAALMWIGLGWAQGHAVDKEALADPGHYVAELHQRGLIDATLQRQVDDVLQVLVAAAKRWPRAHVNGSYDPEAINVYVLKDVIGMRGTLQAVPNRRLVFADGRYLAELKAATQIYFEGLLSDDRSMTMADTLIAATAEGPDHAIRSRLGHGADWRQGTNGLFDGALAFLLAHELGHVRSGLAPAANRHEQLRHLTGRDRDRAWACASLVGEQVNRRRAEEADADAYAVALLGSIRDPTGAGLRYEMGTMFLQVAELGKVSASLAALSPRADELARAAGIGVHAASQQAMADALSRDAGMIETAFPASHPAQVDRLLSITDMFSKNPVSTCCGDLDNTNDRLMWGMLIKQTCGSIQAPASGR